MIRPSDSCTGLLKSPVGALALVTVTGMLPVLVMVNERDFELPIGTSPKSRELGENSRCPCPVMAVAVIGTLSVCVSSLLLLITSASLSSWSPVGV